MYEIYAYTNGDLDKKLLVHKVGTAQYQVMTPKLTREVSKSGSLTFVMTRDHPQYDNLPKMRTIVSVHQDGKEIWRGRVLKHEADWLNRRTVYCEGALAFFNDSCITPFIYEGKLAEFLQNLLDIHNYQVYYQMKQFRLGTVSAALGDLIVRFGDGDEYGVGEDFGSILEIISNLVLKTFGGYVWCTFDPDTGYNVLNYCDEAYEADRQTAQKIEYGQNLLDFTERTDTNNLMTRIYPVGNKHTVTETKWKWKILWWGEKYTESHEERYGIMGTDKATIEKYLPEGYTYDLTEGYIQSTVAAQKFGVVGKIMGFDTDSDNDTFAAGVQALQQNSAMTNSYTIKAVDLVDAGYNTDRLTFASFAHIRSVPHSIDAIMLCSKLVEPLDNPSKKEFTFGMTRRTFTDRQVANLGQTNLNSESAAASSSYVKNAAKVATDYIVEDESGTHFGLDPDKSFQIGEDGLSFNGIRNKSVALSWMDDSGNGLTSFSAQTVYHDFSGVSAVLLTFESNKDATWFASVGGGGAISMVVPVNGKTYSMVYPWNTPHRRNVTVYPNKIVFGDGYERLSKYGGTTVVGIWGFDLQTPLTDGWAINSVVCIPRELYEFM